MLDLEKLYSLVEEKKILFSSTVNNIDEEINEYLSAWWCDISEKYILIHGPFTNSDWQKLDYIIFDKQKDNIITDFNKKQFIVSKFGMSLKKPITYNQISLKNRNFFNVPIKYIFDINKNNIIKKYEEYK